MWTNDLMLGAKGFLRLINCYHISGFVDCNTFECHHAMEVFGSCTTYLSVRYKRVRNEKENTAKSTAIVNICVKFDSRSPTVWLCL